MSDSNTIAELRYIYDRVSKVLYEKGVIEDLATINLRVAKIAIRIALVEMQKQRLGEGST